MPTVIRPQHDNRIILVAIGLQSIQHPSHLTVHKTDTRQVRLNQRLQLSIFQQIVQTRFRQFPMQVPGKQRSILAIAQQDGREFQCFQWVEIKPLLSRITRHMRQEKTDRHEERTFGFVIELIHSPGSHLPIPFILVFVRESSPVYERMRLWGFH